MAWRSRASTPGNKLLLKAFIPLNVLVRVQQRLHDRNGRPVFHLRL
jgi:hypothetical protein